AGRILIGIGLWGLRHVRSAETMSLVRATAQARWQSHSHSWLGLFVGFADGLVRSVAGNGALLATIPAVGLGAGEAQGYLLGFGVATVVGVLCLSIVLGLLSSLPFRGPSTLRTYRRFLRGVALSSVALGVIWLGLTS